jgi:cob(I)alamin adenosyltransferase
MVGLSAHEKVTPAAIKYMNRLSDFLFVLSRFENAKHQGDVLWVPGENR